MSGPLLLPTWEQLGATHPGLVATMGRYLQQVACVLRPGSVNGADLALRSFTAFLVETSPALLSTADLTRRHVEEYKPWLARRPGQNKARLTAATLAHRLGTLRMFFIRIDEWGWEEAPARIPMFPGDLPRQDHPLPKALDDAAAAKLLRAAQNDKRLLVRVAVEVLLRTGLRVSEFTGLRADAVVQIGAGPCLHDPVGKVREDRYLALRPQLVAHSAESRTAAPPPVLSPPSCVVDPFAAMAVWPAPPSSSSRGTAVERYPRLLHSWASTRTHSISLSRRSNPSTRSSYGVMSSACTSKACSSPSCVSMPYSTIRARRRSIRMRRRFRRRRAERASRRGSARDAPFLGFSARVQVRTPMPMIFLASSYTPHQPADALPLSRPPCTPIRLPPRTPHTRPLSPLPALDSRVPAQSSRLRVKIVGGHRLSVVMLQTPLGSTRRQEHALHASVIDGACMIGQVVVDAPRMFRESAQGQHNLEEREKR